MTPEERKEYNKQYYANNKDTIISNILKKETCELCGRSVNHQRVKQHQTTQICIKHRNRHMRKTKLQELKGKLNNGKIDEDYLNEFINDLDLWYKIDDDDL